jgi:hypothetical protein
MMANPIAPIVLQDGKATPVDKTFDPTTLSPTVKIYADHNADTIQGRKTVSIGNRPLTSSSGNYKATMRVRIPVVFHDYNDLGDHHVMHTLTANVEFVIPGAASDSDIDDLFAFTQNMFAESQFQETVKSGVLPY